MNKLITIIFVLTIATSVAFPLRAISQTTNREEYEQSRNEMIEDMKRRSAEDARLTLKMEPVVVFLIFVLASSALSAYLMSMARAKKASERFGSGKTAGSSTRKVEKKVRSALSIGQQRDISTRMGPKGETSEGSMSDMEVVVDAPAKDKHHEKVRVKVKYSSSGSGSEERQDKRLKKVRSRKRKSK